MIKPFFSLFFLGRVPDHVIPHGIQRFTVTRGHGNTGEFLLYFGISVFNIPYSKYSVSKEYTILPPTSTPLPSVIFSYAIFSYAYTHLRVLEFTSCSFAVQSQPVIETIRVSERLVVVVSKSYLLWTR